MTASNPELRKLAGGNMDIDLTSNSGTINWEQEACPWNVENNTHEHRCAVKNTSICPYFCGIEYLDIVLCCYPNPNPLAEAGAGNN
ncbi:MAG: hypothetical protein JXA13_12705 [Anaerolineales bacterium]|nr:hypothetical protein [Anaerolineales bacterium]